MTNLLELRKQKDWFFENDQHSPLPVEQKEVFQGLNYFPGVSLTRYGSSN